MPLLLPKPRYSSSALIVIFAFSTFDTGHPFSAASAYFWNVAASAPGTLPTTSMWLAVIVHPEYSLSSESVTVVEMFSGVRFAPPNCADSAIEKQPACAAAINSSGLVPGALSNRVANEYCVLFKTPPGAERLPFPSFNPPFQTALALRCIDRLLFMISQTPLIVVGTHQSCQSQQSFQQEIVSRGFQIPIVWEGYDFSRAAR